MSWLARVPRHSLVLADRRMSTAPAPMVSVDSGVSVVTFGPECENLGEVKLDLLRDKLLKLGDQAQPPWVLVDLSHVKFFGSSFIEVLFGLWHKLDSRGDKSARLMLCGLTAYCAEVLSVTHLDTLWPAYPDRRTAVTQFLAGQTAKK